MCLSLAIRILALLALAALLPLPGGGRPLAQQAALKVGIVNMDRALNESEAGQRSIKIFSTSKSQIESELKAKEEKLNELEQELKTNIMLTQSARTQKEQQYQEQKMKLLRDVQTAQRDVQNRWQQIKDSLVVELQSVVSFIAKEEKFDLVLARNISDAVLYSRFEFTDITDKVIQRYNRIQKSP